MVVGTGGEIACGFIPESGIQFDVRGLGGILGLDGILRDSVNKSCAGNADGAFKTEAQLITLGTGGLVRGRGSVEGTLRNCEFGVDERVCFAVREAHGQSALHRADGNPADGYLRLVDVGKEGSFGHGLRHSGDFRNVWAVVGIIGILMIDYQKVAVTEGVGTVGLVA